MALPIFPFNDIILVTICMQNTWTDRGNSRVDKAQKGGGSSPLAPPLPTPLQIADTRKLTVYFAAHAHFGSH